MKKIFFLIVLIIISAPLLYSFEKEKLAVGLNHSGLGVRYFYKENVCWEVKAQSGENINIFGGRLIKYLDMKKPKWQFLKGFELDLILFEGSVSRGNGVAGEIFAGGEYFFEDKYSLNLDFGPAVIMLSDTNYSISQYGFEFVVNFGIYYYFRRGSK
jgi:hypothetical protein